MPKIDLAALPQTNATGYPQRYAAEVAGRWHRKLGPASGLTDFGITHVVLDPGAWSSQRHWHEDEDEFVVVLEGEAVLVDDQGDTPLRAGDCAAFPKGDGNGHVIQNRSDRPVALIAVGRVADSACHYPDIDMHKPAGSPVQHSKAGIPYSPAGIPQRS